MCQSYFFLTADMDVFNSLPNFSEALKQATVFIITSFIIYKYISCKTKKYPPGPIGLPFLGFVPFLEKEPHKQFLKLGKKYGENLISLRLGKNFAVILNEYKVAKQVLSAPLALDRHPDIFTHIKERGFFTKNGEEWVEQRKFCLRSTRELGLGTTEWENMIQEEVGSLIEDLCGHKGQPVTVTESIKEVTSSNVISLLIGRRLDRKTERDKIKLIVGYMDQSMSTGLSLPVTAIPKLRELLVYFKVGQYYIQQRTVDLFSQFINEEIRKHKKQAGNDHASDFIDSYLAKINTSNSSGAKHYFTEGNLEGNLNVLFLGGSDTVATSVEWLLSLMAAHQDVQKQVRDEIDEVLGMDGKICYSQREKLPFTMAVIYEAQRFSTTVPLSPDRRAIEDIEVNGFTIPKGCHIIPNLWAIHHDPNYWEKPEEFKPERFLTEDKKTVFKNVASFGPFSFGRRNCPAESIAYTELLQIFVILIQRFIILPPEGGKVNFETDSGFVPHLKPQPLRFIDRFDAIPCKA